MFSAKAAAVFPARVPVSLEMEEKAGNCICMALFTVLSRPQFSTSKSEWGL